MSRYDGRILDFYIRDVLYFEDREKDNEWIMCIEDVTDLATGNVTVREGYPRVQFVGIPKERT